MYFEIKTYIYPIKIGVFIDENDESVINELKYYTKEELSPLLNMTLVTTGRCHLLSNLDLIIRFNSCPDKYDMLGIIFHEVMHATFLMLDRVGCEYIKNGNNESFTYLGEYIYKEICKQIEI